MDFRCLIDCPSCGNTFEGQWHADVMDIEQLDGPPEGEQACPECDEINVVAYPGWVEFGGAG